MSFQVEDISFFYGEKEIIQQLSLILEPGKFYGLIGPNGCGKSTLLDILIRVRKPASGRITFNGKPLDGYSKRALSKVMALVPQNFYINFPFTAEEVVMMGRYPHIPRFAQAAVEDIRMVKNIMKRTETEQFKNRFISELSGGERQRVVIARALAQDTPFLFLDEATSNLDINHALSLLNLAKEGTEKSNKTVVSVMQDINLAALFCDEFVFMKEGQVVMSGPARETLKNEILKEVFDVDSKITFDDYADANQVVFKR